MPLLNGLDAARQLKHLMPEVKLIFLTVSEDPDLAAEAFRAGASGYLLKNSAASELLQAIQEVSQGRSYVTPLATQGLVGSFLREPGPARATEHLTDAQREVLQLLAEGRTMKEIARILKITPRTVAFHKYSMMEISGSRPAPSWSSSPSSTASSPSSQAPAGISRSDLSLLPVEPIPGPSSSGTMPQGWPLSTQSRSHLARVACIVLEPGARAPLRFHSYFLLVLAVDLISTRGGG